MKIAFFAHYAGIYGANQSLMTLVEGLRERRVKPLIFVPSDGTLTEWLREREVESVVVDYQPWMAPPRRWLLAPIRFWRNRRAHPLIRQRLLSMEPDLIHSNSSVLGIGMRVATGLELPHVWHLREFAQDAFQMRPDLGWRHMHRWLDRSTAYIAVSHALKESLLSPEAQSRCAVIYNGVLHRAQMESLRKLREGVPHGADRTFSFLMVGRISPLKGQVEAIEALAQLEREFRLKRKLKLILVGGGNRGYVDALQRKALQLGIGDRVEFVGFVDNPFPFYVAANVVLICSRSEGMGRVTAEAMAVGVPVIGRDTTGTSELIQNEKTGLLYNGHDQTLAVAMLRLIEDPGLRTTLSEQAWIKAYEDFSIETYCSRTHELFKQVVQGE